MPRLKPVSVLLLCLVIGLLPACDSFGSSGSSGAAGSVQLNGRGPSTQIMDLPEGTYWLEIEVSDNKVCTDSAFGPVCESRDFMLETGQYPIASHRGEAWADVVELRVGTAGHVPTRFPIVIVAGPDAAWQLRFTPTQRPTPTPEPIV